MGNMCPRQPEKLVSGNSTIYGLSCPASMQTHLELKDFQFIRAIGHGCASTVFEAMHTPSSTRCVLKVCMKERLYPEAERRMRREIHIHSSLRHPCILAFFASFEDAHAFYFVLEYAQNGDLLKYIRQNYNGIMSESDFKRIVLCPLIHALSYLHDNHIIHRDIKPENILVDGLGNIRLCDFGFSVNNYEERPKSFLGTLEYMAPEIISGKRDLYSEKIDVWALGVLTYECLAGVSPFYHTTEKEIQDAIVKSHYTIPANFSSDIINFLKHTLHPDPYQRMCIKDLMKLVCPSHAKSTPHITSLRRSHSFS